MISEGGCKRQQKSSPGAEFDHTGIDVGTGSGAPEDTRVPCDSVPECHKNATCVDGYCQCNDGLRGDGLHACFDQCVCRLLGDPIINMFDGQVLMLSGVHKYTMAKCMVDPWDVCSFNVEIKAGYARALRQHRVRWGTTMLRFLDIETLGSHIRIGQNHEAMVDKMPIDVTKGAFVSDEGFVIYEHRDDDNPKEDFVVFKSERCGFEFGFYGGGMSSVAVLYIPARYSGCMIGLCGNCDGIPNDLRTRTGTDVSHLANMFQFISESYIVDESTDDLAGALGSWGNGGVPVGAGGHGYGWGPGIGEYGKDGSGGHGGSGSRRRRRDLARYKKNQEHETQ